ncbi:hypothetical protein OE88DRAFT_1244006 [Heliocybe sulcata]|uniref:F-box domain-containing protein n=1 Tax=Heliocybe sulcata TaxID=5364 RepID=A0A5C3N6E1_9AGAM|nr:hypothetical protein OE88DRAFT_1244006 [Heliocybe sulcata]
MLWKPTRPTKVSCLNPVCHVTATILWRSEYLYCLEDHQATKLHKLSFSAPAASSILSLVVRSIMKRGQLVHNFLRGSPRTPDNGQDALPPEIFNLVLKFLAPSLVDLDDTTYRVWPMPEEESRTEEKASTRDQWSFCTLLLVCTRWYEMAVPLLYHQVYVSSPGRLRRLLRTLERQPSFAMLVHSLILRNSTRMIWCFLRPYKSHRLAHSYRDDLIALFSICKSVQQISIYPPAYFNPPRLDHIDGHKLDISDFPAPRGIWPEEFVHLKSLTLHGDYITQAFLGHPGELPSLEELILIGIPTPARPPPFWLLYLGKPQMQFSLPALHTLRLRSCLIQMGWFHRLNLPQLRTLETTYSDFVFDGTPEEDDHWEPGLPSLLPAEDLQTVQLDIVVEHISMLEHGLSEFIHLQHMILNVDVVWLDWMEQDVPQGVEDIPHLKHLELRFARGNLLKEGYDSRAHVHRMLNWANRLLNDSAAIPLLERLTIRGDLYEANQTAIATLEESCTAHGIEFGWHGKYLPYFPGPLEPPRTLEEVFKRALLV